MTRATSVCFRNSAIDVAGDLRVPPDADEGRRSAAVVIARANNRHSFHVVEGAGHYDLYDKSPSIDEATERLGDFFSEVLAPVEC